MAIMIFAALSDLLVSCSHVFKNMIEGSTEYYYSNPYFMSIAYTLYDIGELQHWVFAIKYLDSATKIQFDTCLTPIIIQMIGWSVAMLYTITMLVMNVWLMISFPENITDTDYDYWY
jgi:hypothetical protein